MTDGTVERDAKRRESAAWREMSTPEDSSGEARGDAPASPSESELPGRSGKQAWLFLAPAVAVLLLITVFPAIFIARASLFDLQLLAADADFIGLRNYMNALGDVVLRRSMIATVLFVVIAVSIQLALGMAIAVPLANQTRGNAVATTLLILPLAVTPAVSALVFRQLLNPNFGWISHYFQRIGLTDGPIVLLSTPGTAWASLIALDVWQWTPFVALILVAGLQGLPKAPLEAAWVEGANRWQAFRYVTLPMLKPFIAVAVVLRTIQAFKTFDSFKILTDGGPGFTTEIINLSIHRIALQSFRVGAASALGIYFLIILLLAVPWLLRAIYGTQGEAERVT